MFESVCPNPPNACQKSLNHEAHEGHEGNEGRR
jgi:hypothetical protein